METQNTQKSHYTGHIPNTPLRFALFAARQSPFFGVFAIICVTLAQLCEVFLPFILKEIIDLSANTGGPTASAGAYSNILFWVLLFPVVTFAMFGLSRASGFWGMEWLTRTQAFSYKILFKYLSEHSHTYFSNRFAGSVTNKLAHASEGTVQLLEGTLWGHYGAVLSLIVSGILIFMTSKWVGFVYVGLIVVLIPLNYVLAKYRQPYVVAFSKQKSAFRGRAIDVITNIGAMRQFSKRGYELGAIGKSVETMRLADVKQWRLSEYILSINNLIIVVSVGSMLMIMYSLWSKGAVTIGDFVLVVTLVMGLQYTLTFIGNSINQFIRAYGEVEEGLEEILIAHEIRDIPNAVPLTTNGGEIVWNGVSFEYGKNRIFDAFNLTIKAGERIGLVGPSGAGKTTFVSLLLRQHDINSGEILIDGQDIKKVTQDSLRSAIAIVPQEPMLFHRTIKENIAYGKEGVTQEELEAVAQKAHAHDFIMRLSEGYNTIVGERGTKLSGGQKQRIAIARAMLKNAPILVLDEATSALDSASEVAIQEALHELMEGKTVIAVAHRLSTLREMDRILVLENGKIVEDGSHAELVEKGGTYSRLWEHQAGGFLLD